MTMYRQDLANGQIKFSSKFTPEDLIKVAEQLQMGSDGHQFKQLAIRGCGREGGKKRYAIAFVYQYDGTEKGFDKFIHKITDKMKREFGNDVHWDISSGLWLLPS